MNMPGIDTGQISAMVAQLRAAAAKMESASGASPVTTGADSPAKLDFADALKSSLDQVNKVQTDSETLGKQFAMGDDKVSLSDVMISMQKANISFQTAVQVRSKLVSAYHDIMSMQI